jgi:hypothetical protein
MGRTLENLLASRRLVDAAAASTIIRANGDVLDVKNEAEALSVLKANASGLVTLGNTAVQSFVNDLLKGATTEAARIAIGEKFSWKTSVHLTSAAATIDVALPSSWKIIKVRGRFRHDGGNLNMRVAYDGLGGFISSAASYYYGYLFGNGATAASGAAAVDAGYIGTTNNGLLHPVAASVTIVNGDANQYPVWSSVASSFNSGTPYNIVFSGRLENNVELTNLRFYSGTANLQAGTSLVLEAWG